MQERGGSPKASNPKHHTRRAFLTRGLLVAGGVLCGGGCGGPGTGARPTGEQLDALAEGLTRGLRSGDDSEFSSWFSSARLASIWRDNLTQFTHVSFAAQGIAADAATLSAAWAVPGEAVVAHSPVRMSPHEADARLLVGPLAGTQQPAWAVEPLTIHTRDDATVVAGVDVPAGEWLTATQGAVSDILSACPGALRADWDETLVVVAPTQLSTFAGALGVAEHDYQDVAGVAWAEPASDAAPMRIYLNHQATQSLAPIDRRVLLAHEGAHIAMRPTMRQAPHWLSEGLAEMVGFTSSSDHRAHGQKLARAYASTHPSAELPGSDAFEPGSDRDLATTYALAQQAVEALFERAGRRSATAFCVAVGADEPWPIAQATVTSWYRQRLAAL